MVEGIEEWNRWRGSIQTYLESLDASMNKIDGRLTLIENRIWQLFGVTIGVALLLKLMEGI